MEEILANQLRIIAGLTFVNVIMTLVVLILSAFVFLKVRLLRRFLES